MRCGFLPAMLAAVTDVVITVIVWRNQPDYPGRFIVFQIVMFGAALLAALPRTWVRLVGLVVLVAGFFISGVSVGWFYFPTVVAAGWVTVRSRIGTGRLG